MPCPEQPMYQQEMRKETKIFHEEWRYIIAKPAGSSKGALRGGHGHEGGIK